MSPSIKTDLKRASKFVTRDQCRRFARRATYARINARRGELIEKGELTAAEAEELETVQAEVRRIVDTAYQFDTEELAALLDDLERATAHRDQAGEAK